MSARPSSGAAQLSAAPPHAEPPSVVVFDLDGTLLDSDAALADAFVALGVPRGDVSFGHVLAAECERLGLSVEDYLAVYDAGRAQPFPGVEEMLGEVGRWSVCSNKHPRSGRAELDRLGWEPEVAWFADRFDGPKVVEPILAELGVDPAAAAFVGDTAHDRACARRAGCTFVLAGWNPRAAPDRGDLVAATPDDVLRLLGR